MLGDQVGCVGKDKKGPKKKCISMSIHQRADPTSYVVQLTWNLEERFETQVATI